MPLETLDFTGVSEGYSENGKPERLGIYTYEIPMNNSLFKVKMESPRDWAFTQNSIILWRFFFAE